MKKKRRSKHVKIVARHSNSNQNDCIFFFNLNKDIISSSCSNCKTIQGNQDHGQFQKRKRYFPYKGGGRS